MYIATAIAPTTATKSRNTATTTTTTTKTNINESLQLEYTLTNVYQQHISAILTITICDKCDSDVQIFFFCITNHALF